MNALPAQDPKAEVGGFFEGPRPQGPALVCEVCAAAPGMPCGHGIRSYRASYGVPSGLRMQLLIQHDNGAECWLLWRGEVFAGRFERPVKPLPGRLLWGLYDEKGQRRQQSMHPRGLDFSILLEGK